MLFTIDQLADHLIQKNREPLRLRVTGFPSCGKTTLSQLIIKKLPNVKHIESECWIYSLSYRKKKDLSGAHPESYNLSKCCEDINKLLKGQEIKLNQYRHAIGKHDGYIRMKMRSEDGLILDGTPFFLSCFEVFAGMGVFLHPKNYEKWLEISITRDVSTRYFSFSEATRHNMRKARDIELVWKQSQNCIVVLCDLEKQNIIYEVIK